MSILYVGTGVGGGGGSIGQANTANALGTTTSIGMSQAMTQQAVLQQQYNAAQAVPNPLAPATFDKNDAAWDASISTLVDVWLAKYGSEWVNEVELIEDMFFAVAATRLLKLNRLEKINVPTSMHAVYRIVE